MKRYYAVIYYPVLVDLGECPRQRDALKIARNAEQQLRGCIHAIADEHSQDEHWDRMPCVTHEQVKEMRRGPQ